MNTAFTTARAWERKLHIKHNITKTDILEQAIILEAMTSCIER